MEAISKGEIAEEVYIIYNGAGSNREHDMFEAVCIGEVTLFEKFMQGVKERICELLINNR